MKVIELLDYGMSLLEDGNIIKADGEIISKEEYQRMQQNQERNKIDWQDIDTQETIDLINNAGWIAKTYEDASNPDIVKIGFAGFDAEGEPFYIRTQTFLGADSNQFAQTEYSKVIYQISKNRPELMDELGNYLEELFETTEQTGTLFEADEETTFLIKSFIKDGYVWKLIFKNGEVSNVKKGAKVHTSADAKSGNSKGNAIAKALATGGFANVK